MLEIFEQNEKEGGINSTNTHYFAGVVPHPLFNLICSEEKHKLLKYMLKLFCHAKNCLCFPCINFMHHIFILKQGFLCIYNCSKILFL